MATLIKQDRDPLYGFTKKAFIKELQGILHGRVKQAYLFGSITRDDLSPRSDIDLILIKETKDTFFKRPLEFSDLYERFPRLDILIYTPEEFNYHITEPIGFWKQVAKEMEPLF